MNKRQVGRKFEEMACQHMARQGFRILERNFCCRQGEIDVIGEEEGYLVFVEVKYRATRKSGSPAEAVTAAKQRKICRAADYYRYTHGIGERRAVRYDVVAMEGTGKGGEEGGSPDILWLKNAFPHVYAGGRI